MVSAAFAGAVETVIAVVSVGSGCAEGSTVVGVVVGDGGRSAGRDSAERCGSAGSTQREPSGHSGKQAAQEPATGETLQSHGESSKMTEEQTAIPDKFLFPGKTVHGNSIRTLTAHRIATTGSQKRGRPAKNDKVSLSRIGPSAADNLPRRER